MTQVGPAGFSLSQGLEFEQRKKKDRRSVQNLFIWEWSSDRSTTLDLQILVLYSYLFS